MKTLFAGIALLFTAACAGNTAAAERMIEKQGVVNAPIEDVWKAWTTTEGVKSFFAPDAKVEARSGGAFNFRSGCSCHSGR